MVALNMTMLNSLSILLGSAQYPNGSIQLQQESQMSGSGDSHGNDGNSSPCCPHSHGCCGCKDPCALDPPEDCVDPLEGIPTDDMSLMILIGLKWPRRDLHWYLDGFKSLVLNEGFRSKRNVDQLEGESSNEGSRVRRQQQQVNEVRNTTAGTIIRRTTTSPEETTAGTTIRNTTTSPEETTAGTTIRRTTTSPEETTAGTTIRRTTTSPEETTTRIPLTEEEIQDIAEFAKEAQLDQIVELLDQDTSEQREIAIARGDEELQERDSIESEIEKANITLESDSPSRKHQTAFRRTDPISTNMARLGTIVGGATLSLATQFSLPSVSIDGLCFFGDFPGCLTRFRLFARPTFETCDPNNPYRNLDGSCNNVANVLWGAAFMPYRRDLGAVYHNGVASFRRAKDGLELPSARLISTTINEEKSKESFSFSILHMTYGQFVDHDLVATPLSRTSNGGYGGGPVKCCNSKFISIQKIQEFFIRFFHPQCVPIKIPSDDPFYKCYGQTCMEFVRSAAAPSCIPGPRNQLNQQTAYLDGSVIYGVKPSDTDELRLGMWGLLKGQLSNDDQMLLPKEENLDDECNRPKNILKGEFCFKAGDGRVNEQILLTFFQTLWAREHNRVAKILQKCNEGWDDEKLFQETRRIVWAQLQQVTYSEYLPTIIGPTLMASSGLNPLKGEEQTTDYNHKLHAGIANNFGAAAYRFGHSLVADHLLYVTKQGKVSPKELSTLYFNPFELYRKDGMCDVSRGGTNLPEDKMDPYFTLEIAGKLFRGPKPFGLDLLALNIQRGRDHGLAPYNKWRVYCGEKKARHFKDLLPYMSKERVVALSMAYTSVDDIDLYVGGVSENPIPGSILGPTFTCLIHNQFFRMKYGDRYWFEYKNGPGAFTKAQMKQLHRVTLSRIMCNNLPELDYIQRWPLRNPGPKNPKVCCKSIRQYNLNPWKLDFNEEDDNDDDDEHQNEKHEDCSDHKDHHDCCKHKEEHDCCKH